ncbi:molybdopterin-dependent oxidoreductase [Euzebya tangerina]|uniref:molybdopterin-dependent oxidoreductase n=1 Tax=Euzebya tangerina TaxID=591198 RepID=UPI000E32169A|nr:molybdopterin-dependent oxidoreductase [Euzebya tangerina]
MTTTRRYAALAGLLATIASLSIGELAAGLVRSWYSPVQAVGDRFIFYTPQPVKQFAIDVFGTADKLALIMGTLIITLIFGAVLGVLGRKRIAIAWSGIVAFGVVGVAASTVQDGLASSVPSVITVAVGIPVITLLLRTAPRESTAASETEGTSDAGSSGRRSFLALSGGLVAASAAAVGTGRALINARQGAIDESRDAIASQIGSGTGSSGADTTTETATRPLGVVDDPLPPLPDDVSFDIEGLEAFQTADEDFYRIDIELATPQIDPDEWSLRIHGMVDNELEFGYEELLRRDDLIEADITMTCVSNEVGGSLVSSGRWTGVPLTNLLEEAGVQDGADQLVGRDDGDFSTGFPVDTLDDGRPAMLALLFNGEPLSAAHGFPARVVVPGLYGYVSATKWIREIELTTFEAFDQYWVERGWDREAPIKLQSRIDVPRPAQSIQAGDVMVAGVAWHQPHGIEAVEIRIDDGEWEPAELAEELNDNTWRQWRFPWSVSEPGNYRVTVRATSTTGEVQTDERQPPFPNGATGLMTTVVTVRA